MSFDRTAMSSSAPMMMLPKFGSRPEKKMPWFTIAKVMRPKDDADDRTRPARQQHAANHHAHDRVEDEGSGPPRPARSLNVITWLTPTKAAAKPGQHVEADRQLLRRDAGVAGAFPVAAEREDPVAPRRDVQQVVQDDDESRTTRRWRPETCRR